MQEVESTDQRRAPPAARPCLAGDVLVAKDYITGDTGFISELR